MGLYKRGKIWWLTKDPVTGVRLSTRCKDKTAAKLFEAERERLAADPTYAASHHATVGDWADRVIALKERTKAAGTQDMYRVKLGHVVRVFGRDCPLADITPPNVDAFIEQRQAEGAANNTIGKELTAILQLCKLARRGGAFAGDVAALKPVGFSIEYTPRERTLSRREAELVLAALPADRAAVFALALITGARHSELSRIDLLDGRAVIRGTKTEGSKNRPVPFEAPWQLELLARVLGRPLRRWPRLSKDLTELAESLGFSAVTANDLRRTFATWMIESGVDRETVARMLGHRGTQMVFKVYGRESPEALGESVRRQIAARTAVAQPSPDGSVCTAPSCAGDMCDSAAVAPERLELSHPEGSGILNPSWQASRGTKRRDFSSDDPSDDRPGPTGSDVVGTRIAQLAAAGFRAQSAAWFRRAAA